MNRADLLTCHACGLGVFPGEDCQGCTERAAARAASTPEGYRAALEVSLAEDFGRAKRHAENCRKCSRPIVADAEGNPGLVSEACALGARLLQAWQDSETEILKHTAATAAGR